MSDKARNCKAAEKSGFPPISNSQCKEAQTLLYETESEYEPGIIHRGYECKYCGAFSSGTAFKEDRKGV